MSGRVYYSGRHQGEGRHLDCSQQRHQELQPGHGGSQPNCEDDIVNNKIVDKTIQQLLTCEQIDKYPGEELGIGIHPVRHHGLENVGSDDVHYHVELEGVGEEDGHTKHQERYLSQRTLWKVESDAGHDVVAVAKIAEEPHEDVEQSDGDHGEVENPHTAQHILTWKIKYKA